MQQRGKKVPNLVLAFVFESFLKKNEETAKTKAKTRGLMKVNKIPRISILNEYARQALRLPNNFGTKPTAPYQKTQTKSRKSLK